MAETLESLITRLHEEGASNQKIEDLIIHQYALERFIGKQITVRAYLYKFAALGKVRFTDFRSQKPALLRGKFNGTLLEGTGFRSITFENEVGIYRVMIHDLVNLEVH